MHDTPRAAPWLDPSPAVVEPVRVAPTPRTRGRLNLDAIAASLRTVQRAFPAINARLQTAREPLSDDVIANLMAGYALIDAAIVAGLNLFALGNLKYLLDLNRRVLCGTDPEKLKDYADHLAATEAHFYGYTEGGIGSLVEWLAGHRHRSPWRQAAGVYIRILSEPQLYLEGNHRCGALIMSYLLAREGKPPFVLTVDNAKAYFDPSTVIKATRKTPFARLFTLPHLGRDFAQFLKAQANERSMVRRAHPTNAFQHQNPGRNGIKPEIGSGRSNGIAPVTPITSLDRPPKSDGFRGALPILPRSKLLWVHRKLALKEAITPRMRSPEYVTGETFAYLGRRYRLVLVTEQPEALHFDGTRFLLRRDARPADVHFKRWYTAAGKEWLPPRIELLRSRTGPAPTRVVGRDLGFRWGSCGHDGALYLNWRLLQFSVRVVDYVLIHELCHLVEPNHRPEFWRLLERALSDWRERKEELHRGAADIFWCAPEMAR